MEYMIAVLGIGLLGNFLVRKIKSRTTKKTIVAVCGIGMVVVMLMWMM